MSSAFALSGVTNPAKSPAYYRPWARLAESRCAARRLLLRVVVLRRSCIRDVWGGRLFDVTVYQGSETPTSMPPWPAARPHITTRDAGRGDDNPDTRAGRGRRICRGEGLRQPMTRAERTAAEPVTASPAGAARYTFRYISIVMHGVVLFLNPNYEPLNVCDLRGRSGWCSARRQRSSSTTTRRSGLLARNSARPR